MTAFSPTRYSARNISGQDIEIRVKNAQGVENVLTMHAGGVIVGLNYNGMSLLNRYALDGIIDIRVMMEHKTNWIKEGF